MANSSNISGANPNQFLSSVPVPISSAPASSVAPSGPASGTQADPTGGQLQSALDAYSTQAGAPGMPSLTVPPSPSGPASSSGRSSSMPYVVGGGQPAEVLSASALDALLKGSSVSGSPSVGSGSPSGIPAGAIPIDLKTLAQLGMLQPDAAPSPTGRSARGGVDPLAALLMAAASTPSTPKGSPVSPSIDAQSQAALASLLAGASSAAPATTSSASNAQSQAALTALLSAPSAGTPGSAPSASDAQSQAALAALLAGPVTGPSAAAGAPSAPASAPKL